MKNMDGMMKEKYTGFKKAASSMAMKKKMCPDCKKPMADCSCKGGK